MASNPAILIVSPDPQLRQEFDRALEGIDNVSPVVHVVHDYRQGVEALRSRRPALALVAMERDLRILQRFAEEAALASPETPLAAAFSPEVFGADTSESATLIGALRAGIRDFLRRPISSNDLSQLLDRLLRVQLTQPTRLGTVTTFLSNKGGVGKSTLAVNVACGLAQRHPERVLLIDASLQLGVCASLLDLEPTTTLTDAMREQDRLDETLLRQLATPHDCGVHLLAAPRDAIEAAEINDELIARVLSLARRSYDYVVVDSFPLLDSVMVAVLDLCDQLYLVAESVVPTIVGATKLLKLLEDLEFPQDRQRLILNRFRRSAENLSSEDVEQRLGRSVDFVVPFNKQLMIATNLGRPHILNSGWFFERVAPVLRRVVADIETIQPTPDRREDHL